MIHCRYYIMEFHLTVKIQIFCSATDCIYLYGLIKNLNISILLLPQTQNYAALKTIVEGSPSSWYFQV